MKPKKTAQEGNKRKKPVYEASLVQQDCKITSADLEYRKQFAQYLLELHVKKKI